ncbi:hypothetical protein BH23CHL1_BH23CHL1_05990 [soil metagenome]
MQSSSTARLTRIPLAVIVILVAGLASGFVALYATETLPGQGDSTSLSALSPVVPPLSTGEGSVSPRHIEALLGPGASLDSPRSTIKEVPVFGPGDGVIDPTAELGGAVIGGTTGSLTDAVSGREVDDSHAIIIRDTGGPWINPSDGSPAGNVNVTAHAPAAFDY